MLVRCRWARRAGTRDFYPALAALVSPLQNIFLPFNLCVPIAQELGQTVVQARLSMNVCLHPEPRKNCYSTIEKFIANFNCQESYISHKDVHCIAGIQKTVILHRFPNGKFAVFCNQILNIPTNMAPVLKSCQVSYTVKRPLVLFH